MYTHQAKLDTGDVTVNGPEESAYWLTVVRASSGASDITRGVTCPPIRTTVEREIRIYGGDRDRQDRKRPVANSQPCYACDADPMGDKLLADKG